MKVDVLTVSRMACYHDSRCDIISAILLKVPQDGQLIQVRLKMDNLLAWGGVDHITGRSLINRLCQSGDELSDLYSKIFCE